MHGIFYCSSYSVTSTTIIFPKFINLYTIYFLNKIKIYAPPPVISF